jgi:hypothetical protein
MYPPTHGTMTTTPNGLDTDGRGRARDRRVSSHYRYIFFSFFSYYTNDYLKVHYVSTYSRNDDDDPKWRRQEWARDMSVSSSMYVFIISCGSKKRAKRRTYDVFGSL